MGKNILIAYFSWSGNIRKIAELIHRETGGTIFEIQPEKPYPSSYNATVEQAKREIQQGYKPPLKTKLDSIELYDTVFIGSPNWWSTIAPPVATFLSEYDFSGKTIVPFCSHGGGGQGRVVRDIVKLCPKSNVLEPFIVHGGGTGDIQSKISEWLRKIGF